MTTRSAELLWIAPRGFEDRDDGLDDPLALLWPRGAEAEIDWDAVIPRYAKRIHVSLLARGIPPDRAHELAQEAWWRVIQSHREGRLTELRLPGVVIAQANYLALDDRRRSQRRAPHDASVGSDKDVAADAPDELALERQVVARDELRRILAVVERAHPNAQRVFRMSWGGGAMSAPEIAAELGISVQRVRQIVCELRQKLRRELRKEADD